MGGRGSFASGKKVPRRWNTVRETDGFKNLKFITGRTTKLPEESHSPNAKYVRYDDKTGKFRMLRVYNKDRLPVLEIAFGAHQGRAALHWHRLGGDVADHNKAKKQGADWDWLKSSDALYKKYKKLIEGVYYNE